MSERKIFFADWSAQNGLREDFTEFQYRVTKHWKEILTSEKGSLIVETRIVWVGTRHNDKLQSMM